ncbi:polysaccharide lyase family 1 protein [Hephaestia sp. GCM10023244]|uniref:pectate lyase family protein n=1 Tax=unclassified Hephaestia TaxID=2631281 RepID=UPI00207756CB|nr:pectate lyase [Hephaestia sp. MAHUQ-44]MCM8732165.1 pectate lyase [Hephaestia sp. MAHUQ-44]
MRPLLSVPTALLAAIALPAQAQQLAFPGAEGAGRFSEGGRGGRVIAVTNLNDAGPGSLRAAIEADGPRTIVFRVSGTIALKSELLLTQGRVTIAGQTAPGDGITLKDHSFNIAADDVIVRYIRARLGGASGTQQDALTVTTGRRIIIDHVSASWSVDETLSSSSHYDTPGEGVWDLSVQWSIIANSLRRSNHDKGEHGYGSLIRAARGARMSYHHNLWANHLDRMPRPGNYSLPSEDDIGGMLDFRSNVFYNWGKERAGYNYDVSTHIQYNFIDNSYIAGPDSKGAIAFEEKNQLARAFYAGNSMNGTVPTDQRTLVTGHIPVGYWLDAPLDVGPVVADPAPQAYERVLARAGASRVRDAIDKKIVEGVRTRTGRIIDNETQDGGWPVLTSHPAPVDSDNDGMPDAWERARGLDPVRADGAADRDRDGWSNLEEYLSELAGDPKPASPPEVD